MEYTFSTEDGTFLLSTTNAHKESKTSNEVDGCWLGKY